MKKMMFAPDIFAGKTALISGGTSGIGLAVAEILVAGGGNAVLMGRDERRGLDALHMLKEPAHTRFIAGDVRQRVQCRFVVEETVRIFGALDILINAAGIYAEGAIEDLSEDMLQDIFFTNVHGVFYLTQEALPYLRQTRGNIVQVASDAGLHGNYFCAAYAATKGAVIAMTRSLALEVARDGVRVNAVAPADILTPLTQRQLDPQRSCVQQLHEMGQIYPMGRIGTSEEAAAVIAFLASPMASWVTGSVYAVDGGLMA